MNFIDGIAISNYRSFGAEPQKIGPFSKVNIFIGKNNSGKSNILRFINYQLPTLKGLFERQRIQIHQDESDVHIGEVPNNFVWGLAADFTSEEKVDNFNKILNSRGIPERHIQNINRFINLYSALFGGLIWVYKESVNQSAPTQHLKFLQDNSPEFNRFDLSQIMDDLKLEHQNINGARVFEIAKSIVMTNTNFAKSTLISAFRQITQEELDNKQPQSYSLNNDLFDGSELIRQLAALEQPEQKEYIKNRDLFTMIESFVKTVTHSPNAGITIPFTHNKILVDIDGNNKILPIEDLGTGIHEVIILAAACTVLKNQIVCIEEPELHLHPLLQKDFINYIIKNTNNQYFISSHSPHLINTAGVSIFHITNNEGNTKVSNAYKISEKYLICQDLGYQPSDLFQTNSIIWVEGPSDRIYLNYWIKNKDPNLIEGIHYSIMFYGGRLLSHLTSVDDPIVSDFISLRRMNQNTSIIMDSDKKKSAYEKINQTKQRIRDEFNSAQGLAWVTDGREIENYLDEEKLSNAIEQAHPENKDVNIIGSGRFGCRVKYISKSGIEVGIDKIKVAKIYTENEGSPDYSILDLDKRIYQIVEFIYKSNSMDPNS